MIPRWLLYDLEAYAGKSQEQEDTDLRLFREFWNSEENQLAIANDPLKKLANYLGCDPEVVDAAMQQYPSPEEHSPDAHKLYKKLIAKDTRIANIASAFAAEIAALDASYQKNLTIRLGISRERLESFARECYEDADSLRKELKLRPRKGGKRLDAIIVASIVYDVFVATNRQISAQHVSGEPVSEFGITVKHALKLWDIAADWRRASEAVVSGERVKEARIWEK